MFDAKQWTRYSYLGFSCADILYRHPMTATQFYVINLYYAAMTHDVDLVFI